jgi:hypothetical protein
LLQLAIFYVFFLSCGDNQIINKNIASIHWSQKNDDDYKNFASEYDRMLDKDLFEKLIAKTRCDISKGYRNSPNITKFLRENNNFENILPQKSKNYINKFIMRKDTKIAIN